MTLRRLSKSSALEDSKFRELEKEVQFQSEMKSVITSIFGREGVVQVDGQSSKVKSSIRVVQLLLTETFCLDGPGH